MEVVIIIALVLLLSYRWSVAGSYYVKFDGRFYYIWRVDFFGYDECMGCPPSLEIAKERIESLKRNPPRKINV